VAVATDREYGLFIGGESTEPASWRPSGPGDAARGNRVAARIKAGTVGINMPYSACPGIPFGGYKQSGYGRELGLETLDLYLGTKSVVVSTHSVRSIPSGSRRERRADGGRRGTRVAAVLVDSGLEYPAGRCPRLS
jgi:hypothetical protein